MGHEEGRQGRKEEAVQETRTDEVPEADGHPGARGASANLRSKRPEEERAGGERKSTLDD